MLFPPSPASQFSLTSVWHGLLRREGWLAWDVFNLISSLSKHSHLFTFEFASCFLLLLLFFLHSAQINAFKASCWFKAENISNTTLQFVVCARHLNDFTDRNTNKCFFFCSSGNWSGIKAVFTFERMASYFLIHVYSPCALIVIISWISFLLPRSSPPARVTLGVTSVLTVVTVMNMLNNSMPKVK